MQLHQARDGAILRRRRGIGDSGEAEMAGPTATHGVKDVRRAGSGTPATGSRYYQGRTRYHRDAGSEYHTSYARDTYVHANVMTQSMIIKNRRCLYEYNSGLKVVLY